MCRLTRLALVFSCVCLFVCFQRASHRSHSLRALVFKLTCEANDLRNVPLSRPGCFQCKLIGTQVVANWVTLPKKREKSHLEKWLLALVYWQFAKQTSRGRRRKGKAAPVGEGGAGGWGFSLGNEVSTTLFFPPIFNVSGNTLIPLHHVQADVNSAL